jgi:endonuclease/exonuclease/phosphatase family metal-dependent hydrolase
LPDRKIFPVVHHLPRPVRRVPARRLAAGVAVLATALLGTSVAAPSLATEPTSRAVAPMSAPLPPPTPGVVRITQANLLSGQDAAYFQADAATVISNQPDFITYNEVPYRHDIFLAPPGYALWRTPGQYTGETPVAWRTDKWTAINQGTAVVSDKGGKLPGQKVEWGIRFANWVTLQGIDGHVVSVISAHLAPETEITEGLQEVGIKNIGVLANQLAAYGPVLMAGDMNFHYGPLQYPRDLLASYGFTSTYDVTGTHFPTGDHRGATIDYVFLKTAAQFSVLGQYNQELYSDHDAVTADLAFTDAPAEVPVSFTPGSFTNQPSGTRAARRAVLDLMVKAVDNAPEGAAIHLTTAKLGDKPLYRSLRAAIDRGVHVQFLTRRNHPSQQELNLMNVLGDKVWKKDWAVGCDDECRRIESRGNLPQTRLLVSRSGVTDAVRMDVDMPAVFSTSKSLTHARVWTSKATYDGAFKRFFLLVGREL